MRKDRRKKSFILTSTDVEKITKIHILSHAIHFKAREGKGRQHSVEHVATKFFPQGCLLTYCCQGVSSKIWRSVSARASGRNTHHTEGDTGPKPSHHPDPENLAPWLSSSWVSRHASLTTYMTGVQYICFQASIRHHSILRSFRKPNFILLWIQMPEA